MIQDTSGCGHVDGSPVSEARVATARCSAQPQDQSLPILPLHLEFVSHFTGKWRDGYRPRWRRKPWWHLMTMLMSLLGGVAASIVIITGSPAFWLLLVLSWMLTVHSCRKAQLVICHHAVHANMTGHKRCDRALVEILSTLLIIQHFEGYYDDHIRTHHSLRLATLADPDLQFLLALGFRPGMSRKALWRHLYRTMVSPRFHCLFLRIRLRVNFIAAPVYRRLMSGMYTAAVVIGLVLTQGWLPFLVVWIVPLFPLYHVAALLQFVSEHRWLHGHEAYQMRHTECGMRNESPGIPDSSEIRQAEEG